MLPMRESEEAMISESKRKLIEARASYHSMTFAGVMTEGGEPPSYDQTMYESFIEGAEWMALEDMAEIQKRDDEIAALKHELKTKLYNPLLDGRIDHHKLQESYVILLGKLSAKDALLREAMKALKDINREELNIQRPGGGYSKSARISYAALTKLKAELGEGE